MSDLELRKFFDFNEADLTANRAGHLTYNQEAGLLNAERGASRIFRGVGMGLILLAGGISAALLNEARKTNWKDLAGIAPALCIVWFICGGFAYGVFKLAMGKNDNSVQKMVRKGQIRKGGKTGLKRFQHRTAA